LQWIRAGRAYRRHSHTEDPAQIHTITGIKKGYLCARIGLRGEKFGMGAARGCSPSIRVGDRMGWRRVVSVHSAARAARAREEEEPRRRTRTGWRIGGSGGENKVAVVVGMEGHGGGGG
jgi:hypothetical protein